MNVTSDARRIECARGHIVAILKTEPETADEFARKVCDSYDGTCIFCGTRLSAIKADVHEFDQWSSREDGRSLGSGP
jgi:hypothetical protein